MHTVLVVDDYASVRKAIRAGLERYPEFSVCGEAVDGAEAIDKATTLHPDFILLDLAMQGMNGMEAASVLKRLMPHVLIVAFSMHSELINEYANRSAAIDAGVPKLCGIRKVVDCFHRLLLTARDGCDGIALAPRPYQS